MAWQRRSTVRFCSCRLPRLIALSKDLFYILCILFQFFSFPSAYCLLWFPGRVPYHNRKVQPREK